MVNRHKGAGCHLGFGAHQGMQKFPVGQIAPHASLEIVGLPHHQFVRRVGGVEPGKSQHPGIIGGQHPVEHAPALDTPGRFLLQHRGLYAAVHIVRGRCHRVGLGVINIFPRVAEQQIPDGKNAQFFKLFGKGGADALEILDRTVNGRHTGPSFLPSVRPEWPYIGKRRTRKFPKFAFW